MSDPLTTRAAAVLYEALARRLAEHVERVHKQAAAQWGLTGTHCDNADCWHCIEVALLNEARAAGLIQ